MNQDNLPILQSFNPLIPKTKLVISSAVEKDSGLYREVAVKYRILNAQQIKQYNSIKKASTKYRCFISF